MNGVLIFKFLISKVWVCFVFYMIENIFARRGGDRWDLKFSFVLFIFYYLHRIKCRRIWNQELRFQTLACYLDLPSMVLFYIFRRLRGLQILKPCPSELLYFFLIYFHLKHDLWLSFFRSHRSSHKTCIAGLGKHPAGTHSSYSILNHLILSHHYRFQLLLSKLWAFHQWICNWCLCNIILCKLNTSRVWFIHSDIAFSGS